MEAAFFDLDKTVIDRASIMAFASDFRREGLLTRRSMLKGAWIQLMYVHRGATPEKLETVRRSVLSTTRGWDRRHVRQVVVEGLVRAIDPITYAEARDLIDGHLADGRRVYLVSAAPAEIVEPLAAHVGAHEAVASLAAVDEDGFYTGDLERYVYGPVKADLIRHLAERDGLDLDASYAYSDSATDVPMLEAVGNPVAVNPDRKLRRIAIERGWDVVDFKKRFAPANGASHGRTSHKKRTWAVVGSVAAAAAGGGATALAIRSTRSPLGHA